MLTENKITLSFHFNYTIHVDTCSIRLHFSSISGDNMNSFTTSVLVAVCLLTVLQQHQVRSEVGVSEIIEFGKFLKDVMYPGIRETLGKHRAGKAFGIACNHNRRGGFYRWKWIWVGTITCDGLGQWKQDKCKSKSCAFIGSLKPHLKALVNKNVVSREQIIQTIRGSVQVVKQTEIDELFAAISS